MVRGRADRMGHFLDGRRRVRGNLSPAEPNVGTRAARAADRLGGIVRFVRSLRSDCGRAERRSGNDFRCCGAVGRRLRRRSCGMPPRPTAMKKASVSSVVARVGRKRFPADYVLKRNAARLSDDFELLFPRTANRRCRGGKCGHSRRRARFRGGSQDQIFSATSFAVALPAQSLFAAGLAGEG